MKYIQKFQLFCYSIFIIISCYGCKSPIDAPAYLFPRIVFVTDRAGVGNIDGSNQKKLTKNSISDFNPVFSPDGLKITFQRIIEFEGYNEIYIMDSNGSNQKNLTNNLGRDWNPIFSPSDSKIAFESFRDYGYGLYIMDIDGSNKRKLTDDSYPVAEMYYSPPVYSPDGSKIAFISDIN